jgi:hypothetical protein
VDLERMPGAVVGVLALNDPAGFVAVVQREASRVVTGRPVVRRSLVRFGFDGALMDTLAAYDHRASSIMLDEGTSWVPHVGLEFHPIVTYFADGALLIEQPEPEQERAGLLRISRLGASGAIRVLEIPYRPLELSSQASAEIRTQQLQLVDKLPGGLTSARRSVIDVSLSVPAFHPPVADLTGCGDGGTLWIRVVERTGRNHWLVLDRELRPQARVLLPDDVVELSCASENEVWAVRRGTFDVEFVARMRRIP